MCNARARCQARRGVFRAAARCYQRTTAQDAFVYATNGAAAGRIHRSLARARTSRSQKAKAPAADFVVCTASIGCTEEEAYCGGLDARLTQDRGTEAQIDR